MIGYYPEHIESLQVLGPNDEEKRRLEIIIPEGDGGYGKTVYLSDEDKTELGLEVIPDFIGNRFKNLKFLNLS
eukprot:jgi/Orpsp1_1/1189128/evm.model.d7180000069662.1